MDIDGLGEQWCRILIDRQLVSDIADLYFLKKEQLLELERMGERLADKILGNVEASRSRSLSRLLFALGILHVGSEVAELLAQQYSNIGEVAAATEEQLTAIPGIGPKIASSIVVYFSLPHNLEVIEKLRSAGVDPQQEVVKVNPDEMPLSGQTFVVTGTLSAFPRREAESRIKALGGSVASSVTRKTTYLVAGESAGSKLETAQRLETPVLDEAAFLALLAGASETDMPAGGI
jgi:DNA ligase (NAD+)